MTGGPVLVTGAGGFVGARLASRLAEDPVFAGRPLVLTDLHVRPNERVPASVRVLQGSLADAKLRGRLVALRPSIVFHLACVPGGQAERDYDAARAVNVDATLSLFEALRDGASPPRVVFASSVAALGTPSGDLVDDDAPARPVMTYGVQKLMMEHALAQFSRRGELDGASLRLPGVVARPVVDPRLKTSFLSAIFQAARRGEPVTVPVAPEGTTWLASVAACLDCLVALAKIPGEALPPTRTLTMPALHVRIGDLADELRSRAAEGFDPCFEPDDGLQRMFGRLPPLSTPAADALGLRGDADLPALVEQVLGALARDEPA